MAYSEKLRESVNAAQSMDGLANITEHIPLYFFKGVFNGALYVMPSFPAMSIEA